MFIEAASYFRDGGGAVTHSRLGGLGKMSKIGQPLRTSRAKFNCGESTEAISQPLRGWFIAVFLLLTSRGQWCSPTYITVKCRIFVVHLSLHVLRWNDDI